MKTVSVVSARLFCRSPRSTQTLNDAFQADPDFAAQFE